MYAVCERHCLCWGGGIRKHHDGTHHDNKVHGYRPVSDVQPRLEVNGINYERVNDIGEVVILNSDHPA